MSIPIKSKDLCQACKYDFYNWCQAVCGGECGICDNKNGDGKCFCLIVKANTPCPYFKEVQNEAD
ncbi:MAG: hypothetical protein E7467_06125 [Ruminococcaceae bacterium]|nr:hypothetical protein [Oscillospiraceae bacterium]